MPVMLDNSPEALHFLAGLKLLITLEETLLD